MTLQRRDFLKASAAVVAAFGGAGNWLEAAAAPAAGRVIWLQAQGCSGCSVSLLNSIYYDTAANLLTSTLNVQYHPTLMAAAGTQAIAAAQAAKGASGYVLVVEGAIPTGAGGAYCYLWPELTAFQGVQDFAKNAAFILAVGTCATFGGVPKASPNPTLVRSLGSIVGVTKVINIPGCPAHPDWVVGTIAYLLRYGRAPEVDSLRRPKMFFPNTVHDSCPYEDDEGEGKCLRKKGCRGPQTYGDCPRRKWNGAAAGAAGVNWCVLAGSPCQGCTEPGFPDTMSPFYTPQGEGSRSTSTATTSTTTESAASQPNPQPSVPLRRKYSFFGENERD